MPSAVWQYLVERTIIKANLLARGASESFLNSKEVPDGIVVITRQTQIEHLRKQQLWDKISVEEGDLLRIADGHWASEQIHLMLPWCEQLRLLRWVLGLDPQIMPLAHFPKPDPSLTPNITKGGQSLFEGKRLANTWDIRLERDIARGYKLRCLSEVQSRGLVDGSPELAEWAMNVRNKLDSPSVDILAGVKAVGELNKNELNSSLGYRIGQRNICRLLDRSIGHDHPIDFVNLVSSEGSNLPLIRLVDPTSHHASESPPATLHPAQSTSRASAASRATCTSPRFSARINPSLTAVSKNPNSLS